MNMSILRNTNPYNVPPKPQLGLLGYRPVRSSAQPVKPAIQPVQPQPEPSNIKWGKPTWYLLHTLAEKVMDEKFDVIRVSLLNTLYTICCNLPCPECAVHAKTYLDGINFNAIKSKTELKQMLFQFHNVVNKKKGYPIFDYTTLNETYSKAITIKIIYNFMYHFEKTSKNMKMISNDMYRVRMAQNIKTWFNENINNFTA